MPICGVDYVNRLNQLNKPETSATPLAKWLLGGCLLFVFGLGIGGTIIIKQYKSNQLAAAAQKTSVSLTAQAGDNVNQDQESMLAVVSQDDSPVVQRVAGVSTEQNPTSDQSSFSLVTATTTSAGCSEQPIFVLGEKESDPSSPPADEFNWVGALEVLPDYPQPFEIPANTTEEFPWRTTLPAASPITLNFNYSGTQQMVTLTLGWAVGNQGTKAISVSLDDQVIKTTAKHQAQLAEDSWQYMQQVSDQVSFELTTGQHSLTLKPLIESGDAIIWDYIRLDPSTCGTN